MNRAGREALEITASPHIVGEASVDRMMRDVAIALVPTCAFAVYWFGLPALITLAAAVASCTAAEYLLSRFRPSTSDLGDWSATVTGLLYGLTLPPTLPVWMTVLGGAAAIGIGKFAFGGLGSNVFNPALVGRAFLQAAFPATMTQWHLPTAAERWLSLPGELLTLPFARPAYDAISSATPLASFKFEAVPTATADLLLGLTAGSLGETSSILLLAGGAYLLVRRVINWRIPLALLATVGALSAIGHGLEPARYGSPLFMLFSGGLMLGAIYMATDPVASPTNQFGCWVYGILIGVLVISIRNWGGLPEGVMYAVLIGNACSPLINRWTEPLTSDAAARPADE